MWRIAATRSWVAVPNPLTPRLWPRAISASPISDAFRPTSEASHYALKWEQNKEFAGALCAFRTVSGGSRWWRPSLRPLPQPRHEGCRRKHGADHLALRSDPPPVDDPQGAVAHPLRFDEVFFHNGAHVPRRDARSEERRVGKACGSPW